MLVTMALALAACSGGQNAVSDTAPAGQLTQAPTAENSEGADAQSRTASEPTATSAPTATPEPTAMPEPTAEPTAEFAVIEEDESGAAAEQIEPSEPASPDEAEDQPSLVDQLIASFPGAPQAAGTAMLLYGQVLDVNGDPVEGAAVEIWQTDANGVYDHPGDRGTGARDLSFQFYGTSVTGADGVYVFRTVEPGYYEPRPKHIHVKVKLDGREVLTTQFYFEEDRPMLAGEGLFAQAGELGDLLILEPAADVLADQDTPRVLTRNLVIDTGIGAGALTLTPRQGEGPYYPLAQVAEYDNDLTIVP